MGWDASAGALERTGPTAQSGTKGAWQGGDSKIDGIGGKDRAPAWSRRKGGNRCRARDYFWE